MKNIPFAVILALALGALACSLTVNIPTLVVGPTQTLSIDEPAPPEGTVAEVEIDLGPGTLEISGGAEGLAEGTIRYNVADWAPTVRRSGATLTIDQGDPEVSFPSGEEVINEWSLRLGEVPLELTINAGAYSGSVDLTGVPLRRLSINDGASDTQVRFDAPNPEEMTALVYNTGASTVTLHGLGNANFSEMTFVGGAGTYTLDFGGELRRDASVSLDAGVSAVRIEIPEGTDAEIVVEGALSDVNALGDWSHDGDTYRHAASGPTLRILVDMGVGSLTLSAE